MARIPLPAWLTLQAALDFAFKATGEPEDAVKTALAAAFRNNQIQTRARRNPVSGRSTQCHQHGVAWDQAKIDWEENTFSTPNEYHLYPRHPVFTDVEVEIISFGRWLGVTESGRNEAVKIPEYLPPYMAFMIRAANALELSANKEPPLKKIIEAWLEDNWPGELGNISNRAIGNMATLLRPPEAQKGGKTKAKNP